jgi:hypothetical protein
MAGCRSERRVAATSHENIWTGITTRNAFDFFFFFFLSFFFFFFFFFLRRYNFREVLAFSTNSFHLGRFLMQSFQFVIFIFVISPFTSFSHLLLGLPSDHVSAGDHSYTF